MVSASYQPELDPGGDRRAVSDPTRASARRRAAALTLTILAHVLILLLLLKIGPGATPPRVVERTTATFSMLPQNDEATKPSPPAKPVKQVKTASGGAAPRAPAKPHPPAATKPPESPPPPPVMIAMGKSMFDSADISKIHSAPGDDDPAGGDSDGAGAGKDSGTAYGPGAGPGGARLYKAEWYTDPPESALALYMPKGGVAPGATADIACRTIPDYRVDNCRSLGESPPGSGLARALREAAWQFRIRPPRIGGKKLIGAWVHIHYDIIDGKLGK
jgi:hypothetical protein